MAPYFRKISSFRLTDRKIFSIVGFCNKKGSNLSIIFELNKANVAFFVTGGSCLFKFSRIFSNETLCGDSFSSQFSNFVLMNFLDFPMHVVQALHLARMAFIILPSTC